ncbi:hypothetical protein CHARACLAT_005986 [Characodon lateralis]|uniref:Uncharacterized protein n=1 Tax=Characodon lateralis TaxID=208331 RepID=A0ABU7CLR2_9TELE|nr:hypothetical protein [Characodon lateralis]
MSQSRCGWSGKSVSAHNERLFVRHGALRTLLPACQMFRCSACDAPSVLRVLKALSLDHNHTRKLLGGYAHSPLLILSDNRVYFKRRTSLQKTHELKPRTGVQVSPLRIFLTAISLHLSQLLFCQ